MVIQGRVKIEMEGKALNFPSRRVAMVCYLGRTPDCIIQEEHANAQFRNLSSCKSYGYYGNESAVLCALWRLRGITERAMNDYTTETIQRMALTVIVLICV